MRVRGCLKNFHSNLHLHKAFRLAVFVAGITAGFLFLTVPSYAYELKGLPGSTWGQVAHDLRGFTGTGLSGYVNQGVYWFDLPADIPFTTFAEYRFRTRSKERLYFNATGPAVGIELKKSVFKFGAETYWERMGSLNEKTENHQLYLNWYHDWYTYTKRRAGEGSWIPFQALTGSTWGMVTHDLDGLTGTSVSTFINEGIDWFDLPGGVTFNTYAEYRLRRRALNKFYFNADGPAVGAEFKKSIFKLGMDYFWETYREQNITINSWRVYMTWYYDWDLKKIKY